MKYSFLEQKKEMMLNIPVADKGIDLVNRTDCMETGFLAKGENVWFQNGKLVTRPGFVSDSNKIIDTQYYGSIGRHNFIITDIMFNHNGSQKKIIYEYFYYDLSGYVICVYLLSPSGSITNLGYLYFARLNDEVFYIPDNVTFYVGKPQNGGGIFAMVSLKNETNPDEKEYRIYEINSALDNWDVVSGYYIPTVYINGRGNAYDLASQTSNATFKGTPMEVESLNLLNGSFYAYFSSDSYSYSFRLPFSNLANESVICRIYSTPEKYTEWIIPAGLTTDKQPFLSTEVTAHLDRAKGIVYFTVPAGNFNVPSMSLYAENNIRFMATVNFPDLKSEVISSTCVATDNSRIVFSGGIAKNKIFYTKYDNPLYFPRNTDDYVGFSDSEVLNLTAADGKIFAFKNNGIYSLSLRKGKSINKTELLSDNYGMFFKNDSFDIKCIDEKVGCNNIKTIGYSDGNLYWLGTDRKLYSMTKSGNIQNISSFIQPMLDKISYQDYYNGSLTCFGEHCLLSFGTKAFIIDMKTFSVYSWTLPDVYKIVQGVSLNEKTFFLLENTDFNRFFIATLQEGEDKLISNYNVTTYEIESEITTPRFRLCGLDEKARIKNVVLQLDSFAKTEIRIKGNNRLFADFVLDRAEFSNDSDDLIKLFCDMGGAKWFEISLKCNKGISLGETQVSYIKSD